MEEQKKICKICKDQISGDQGISLCVKCGTEYHVNCLPPGASCPVCTQAKMRKEHDFPELECKGKVTLRIRDDNLLVTTKRTEEVYPLSNIQSIVLGRPKGLSNYGSIKFQTAQSNTSSIHWGFGISSAFGAENIYFFEEENYEDARLLVEYVSTYSVKKQVDSDKLKGGTMVDEIRGLKDLMDEGIITEAEFESKKRQLLEI